MRWGHWPWPASWVWTGADAAAALAGFEGVARRFERRGHAAGVDFIDDYAHLPTEVAGALKAASEGGWDRVVCVFQPHRFTRTSNLWRTFAHCFEAADQVIITDIYAAGEPAIPGVSGELIWRAVYEAHPESDVTYVARLENAADELVDRLRPGDLCLTLGAGDLTQLPDLGDLEAFRAAMSSIDWDRLAQGLARVLGEDAVVRERPIGPDTTYRVGGAARVGVTLAVDADMDAVAEVVAAGGIDALVVGKGSNLLVADAGFDGMAVWLGPGYDGVEIDGERGPSRSGGRASGSGPAKRRGRAHRL